MNIFEFFIGTSAITTALIFIAKFAIKWIGDAGLEKYKSELQNATLKYQNNLDKDFEAFKIKNDRLHIEQVEIIKKVYSKLVKAEKPLENIMNQSLKQSSSKTDEEFSKEVVLYANDFFDYFDENEVIFNEDTCDIIKLIKEKYIAVWKTYNTKLFMENYSISKEMFVQIAKDMKEAYENILQGEMQKLKKELKKDFRMKLGIIGENTSNIMPI